MTVIPTKLVPDICYRGSGIQGTGPGIQEDRNPVKPGPAFSLLFRKRAGADGVGGDDFFLPLPFRERVGVRGRRGNGAGFPLKA